MQERNNLVMRQRRLDLAEARDDEARLTGHCQRVERRFFEEPFGARDEIASQANITLETAREEVALDGFAKGDLRRSHPDAAPRQFCLEIRYRFAVGSDDKADQIRSRPHRARDDA